MAKNLKDETAVTETGQSTNTALTQSDTHPLMDFGGIDLSQYEVQQVTRTVLQHVDGRAILVTIESPIFQAAPSKRKPKEGEVLNRAPDLCEVVNQQTGELQLMVCNAVLRTTIEDKYPLIGEGDDAHWSYVGKTFAIMSLLSKTKDGSKPLRLFQVFEVFPKGDARRPVKVG